MFKEFKIPFKISKDFSIDTLSKNLIVMLKVNQILSKDTIDFFESNNLNIREVQLFTTLPKSVGNIHIDGHTINKKIGALNYVINNDLKWLMEWYSLINNKETTKLVSKGNTDYMKYNYNDVDFLKSHTFKDPCLVSIGIPHRVVNYSSNIRYCVSVRFLNNNLDVLEEKLNEAISKI